MKKVLLIFLILCIYLYISYAYFYNFLGTHNLLAPVGMTTTFGNNPGIKTLKYLSLGDSLTAGVGVSDYRNAYPFLVAEKLSAKNNVELINLAKAGATSKDLLAEQIPQAISIKPDFITLLIGINDIHNLVSLEQFEYNLTESIKTLNQNHTKIYLLSIPYLGSEKIVFFPYNLILDLRTKQFNNVIKKVSVEYNIHFVDLYSLSKPADFYSEDQFHPGAQGYKIWPEAIHVN